MNPQIGFSHVLGELAVNRQDPCEVLRELISNSYDAGARNMLYLPLLERKGFVFFDDGEGLSTTTEINEITPWEAFFSIGKSTKQQGASIGYKCQGSKLLFASSRIFVATKDPNINIWNCITIENPRMNLNLNYNIKPVQIQSIKKALNNFYLSSIDNDTSNALKKLYAFIAELGDITSTLIIVDGLDTEDFSKYFTFGNPVEESYVYNYIRFYTRHGDVRWLTEHQGFDKNISKNASDNVIKSELFIPDTKALSKIPFGYPYLETKNTNKSKPPEDVTKLSDGKFFSRAATVFQASGKNYSIIFLIDGNRRALDEYKNLDRKGGARSGIKLSSQRGLFISVNGIKICKYQEIFSAPGLGD